VTTDSSPKIDYAPAPPTLRSARARRWAIIIGVILLLIGIATVTPRAVRRLQVAYWHRQCLEYIAPADQVIHETDRAEIPRLLAPPLNYRGSMATGQAFLIPPAYQSLWMSQSVGTAFLHERITPQGQRRLVAVDLFSGGTQPGGGMTLNATVIDPSVTPRGPNATVTITRGDGATIALQPGDKLRVFAGQPDPNDASHFTIDYLINDARHTVDGWLKDDGLVIIEARD
jgi:hypothetical protein